MLRHYRELLQLRREQKTLATGGLEWLSIQDDAVLFERRLDKESIKIAVARAKCEIDISGHTVSEVLYGSAGVKQDTLIFEDAGVMMWR
jgi:alpha-glucosidase